MSIGCLSPLGLGLEVNFGSTKELVKSHWIGPFLRKVEVLPGDMSVSLLCLRAVQVILTIKVYVVPEFLLQAQMPYYQDLRGFWVLDDD